MSGVFSKGRARMPVVLSVIWLALTVFTFPHHGKAKLIEVDGRVLDIAMPGEFIPNEIVVTAKTLDAEKEIFARARQSGGRVVRNVKQARMYLLDFPNKSAAAAAVASFRKFPQRYNAYPNYKVSIPMPPQAAAQLHTGVMKGAAGDAQMDYAQGPITAEYTSDDPAVTSQYWLWRIKEPLCPAPAVAAHHIAIIDTGVDYTHPDLSGKVVKVFDYVDWDKDPMDENGHGTHCAGIAAAKANNGGIRGVSPRSKIYAYRVLNRNGSGSFLDVMNAIYDAADNTNVSILSLSLGGSVQETDPSFQDMQNAVNYAVITKNKILCASAGNDANITLFQREYDGTKYRPLPAWIPSSFTVGASDQQDFLTYFSNYDVANLQSDDGTKTYNFSFVDIVAPGYEILSTYPDYQYTTLSGTSMATPMVAGACARLWDHYPALTNLQVMQRLVNNGVAVGAAKGFPASEKRLDLYKAVKKTSFTGFQGQIIHGENGYPLEGVTVKAVSGGTVQETTTTNRAGFFTLRKLSDQMSYTLKYSKTGFVARQVNAGKPTAGLVKDLSLEPVVPGRKTTASDQNWRIVVYWKGAQSGLYRLIYDNVYGTSPGFNRWYPHHYYDAAGMEANAYLRDPGGATYSWATLGSLGRAPFTRFMHDSFLSTPVECHVIQRQAAGVYKYWLTVSPTDDGWGAIKYAPGTPLYPNRPIVIVYKGNVQKAVIKSANAVQVGSGTKHWYVFDLNGDALTVVNKIQDTTP